MLHKGSFSLVCAKGVFKLYALVTPPWMTIPFPVKLVSAQCSPAWR